MIFFILDPEPAVFYAYSFQWSNRHCSLMSNPFNRYCLQQPYYSSTEVKVENDVIGSAVANNALWIKHGRFALARVGNENQNCVDDKDIFYRSFINAMAYDLNVGSIGYNYDHFYNNTPKWG